jgi:multisubunit Na+/H+ antiporter MnhE subunit
MKELDNKKRKLPRHIDGRIMVGLLPIKNFFILLPIAVAIIVLVIRYFNPAIFYTGVVFMGILIGMFCEFHQKETGFSIVRSIIRYAIEGNKFFERNTVNVNISKRLIRNKIKEKTKN